jgi:anti-anti-sigma regulatory factor
MLHVRHEAGTSCVVLSLEGSLDGVTADALAATVALTPPTAKVVVNLCEAVFAGDVALARLARALATTGRLVLFEGLRGRQKRVVEQLKSALRAPLPARR